MFGLRGPYFAIGTLGLALAAAELIAGWDYVGGGGGISMPVFPGDPDVRSLFFYYMCFAALAVATFAFLKWLYSTRFGLAINAIRDNENKAEAMGVHTKRYKMVAWSIAAFFLGIIGAVFGNMVGFVEPLEVAFPTITFGIFMVAMALLGGKGTLWGPVLGATLLSSSSRKLPGPTCSAGSGWRSARSSSSTSCIFSRAFSAGPRKNGRRSSASSWSATRRRRGRTSRPEAQPGRPHREQRSSMYAAFRSPSAAWSPIAT